MLRGEAPRRLLRADDVPLDVVHEVGQAVMEMVAEKRTTWTRWNLHSEASRQLMGWRFASLQDREAITGLIADAAERASLRLTPPELASSPLPLSEHAAMKDAPPTVTTAAPPVRRAERRVNARSMRSPK